MEEAAEAVRAIFWGTGRLVVLAAREETVEADRVGGLGTGRLVALAAREELERVEFWDMVRTTSRYSHRFLLARF